MRESLGENSESRRKSHPRWGLAHPSPILLLQEKESEHKGFLKLHNAQMVLVVKHLPANAGEAGDMSSIPRSGRSHGGGNGNPLQSSCLENSMDRGAWRATVHGVTESETTEVT